MSDVSIDIELMVRQHLRGLQPYRSARHDFASGILLDANENPESPVDGAAALNRYPDPLQNRLRERLAEINGVTREEIFAGSGSDEAIDLLIRLFCNPGVDSILVCEPTYGMYRVSASIHDVATVSIPLTGRFQLDLPALLERCSREPSPRLIFCCSPNNPTGNLLLEEDIVSLCAAVSTIVVVDEAYIEFASVPSLARLVARFPNLVILRTLSKAWGLAGLRIGYAIATPSLIAYLMKIKHPYNIGSSAAATALEVLADPARMERSVATLVAERERLAGALRSLRFIDHVYPSDANYILIRCAAATALQRSLAAAGIIVRDRSSDSGLADSLRITVGTPEENDALLELLSTTFSACS